MEIIPAIMPKNFEDLREKMSIVNGSVSVIQIDVMDGVFVPNKTWPYAGDPQNDFKKIVSQEEDFPFLSSLDFEVDLMVSEPQKVLESWVQAGAKRFVFHKDNVKDLISLVAMARTHTVSDDNALLKQEIGVAIHNKTHIEDIFSLIPDIDFVQVMGISRVGFQGEPFNDEVLGTIRTLRENFPDLIISVDGGVGDTSIEKLAMAGVNRVVVGSAVFSAEDSQAKIEEYQSI